MGSGVVESISVVVTSVVGGIVTDCCISRLLDDFVCCQLGEIRGYTTRSCG